MKLWPQLALAFALALLLMAAAPAQTQALQLVENGDFEQPFDAGWKQQLGGLGSIDRGTTYEADPDYEAHVSKMETTGSNRLYQVIPIPSLDVRLSFRARMNVLAGSEAWAAAMIGIAYLDAEGSILGETRVLARAGACPFTDRPDLHLIAAPGDDAWHETVVQLSDEMAWLPAVDPMQIRSVRLQIWATTVGC